MSFYENVLLSILISVMGLSLKKWDSSLGVIIILEFGSLLVLSSLYFLTGGLSWILILFMAFFVGEALVLLAALYHSLQLVGASYGSVHFL